MKITVPDLCLILLIGACGSGKSSFGKKYFKNTEVISSDFCRGLVSDDENDQACSSDAFDVARYVAAKRLAAGKLTVVDATNVNPEDRKEWLDLARKHDCLCATIAFNIRPEICHERNSHRPDRTFGEHVVRRQTNSLRRSLRSLAKEGFRYNYILTTPDEVDRVTIERVPLWTNKSTEHGPFDIIGDIHGCYDELRMMLERLGYVFPDQDVSLAPHHPDGRREFLSEIWSIAVLALLTCCAWSWICAMPVMLFASLEITTRSWLGNSRDATFRLHTGLPSLSSNWSTKQANSKKEPRPSSIS